MTTTRHPITARSVSSFAMIVLALLTVASRAMAAWEPRHPPAGSVAALAVDPTDPTLILTDGARSTDGGATWQPTSFATSLAFDPSGVAYRSVTGYVDFHRALAIARSDDGGVTWTPLLSRSFPGCPSTLDASVATDPVTSGVVLVGGFLRTTNGGASWADVGAGLDAPCGASAIAIAPADPTIVYAARGDDGVFKSTDGGVTYARVDVELGADYIQSLAIDPIDSTMAVAGDVKGHVYRTADGGVTWQPEWSGLGVTRISALVFAPGCPHLVFAAAAGRTFGGLAAGGVFRSEDGGFTWHELDDGIPKVADVFTSDPTGVLALAVDPSTPARLYAGTKHFWVFRSDNGGGQWSPSFSGRDPEDFTRAIVADPADPATLYADVWRTHDGGRSWTPITEGLTTIDVRAIAAAPSVPSMLYAATIGGVFESTDGGALWEERSNAIFPYADVTSIVVDPGDPLTAYVAHGQNGVVQKTTDGGFAWTVWNPPGAPMADHLAIDPATPSTLYGSTFGTGVTRSTNAGVTWTAADSGIGDQYLRSLAIDPSAPQVLYAAGNGGVYVTLDGAASWSQSAALPSGFTAPGVVAVNPVNRALYVAGQGNPRLLESAPGAGAWTDRTLDLPGFSALSLAVTADGRALYHAGQGIYRLQVLPCTDDADCDDASACTSDACDLGTGACISTALADDTACSDGNGATTDACVAGTCRGLAVDSVCPATSGTPGAILLKKMSIKVKGRVSAVGTLVLGVGETVDAAAGLTVDVRAGTSTNSYGFAAAECVTDARQVKCRAADKRRKLVLRSIRNDPSQMKLTLKIQGNPSPSGLSAPLRMRLTQASTGRVHVGGLATCTSSSGGVRCKY